MVLQKSNGDHNLQVYYGDLHNHCDLSYGRGSFDDAIKNARLQLDFASVTVHAVWPDLPTEDKKLAYLVKYHQEGFKKATAHWPDYLKQVEALNQEGAFILFPSFEWHSCHYGDYCVYYQNGHNTPLIGSEDLPTLREKLSQLPTPSILIPHHIGYKQGYRGINWETFSAKQSPVAEIFSFHGSAESSEGPYPYLHSMGPRHAHSCAQYGWSLGHIFGVIGSTDHHNAFPGSHGAGKLGVWADSLTRKSIWDAVNKRRTYALTGDKINLSFMINNHFMGDICPPNNNRQIKVKISAGDAIDYIDVLHNKHIIHRESPLPQPIDSDIFKVYLELGWGENHDETKWDVNFQVINGKILDVEPRFRGYGPTDISKDKDLAYTHWRRVNPNHVHFQTKTQPNPSLYTPSTEGMSFEIQGDLGTIISTSVHGQRFKHTLGELMKGSRTHYLGGFVSPALCFHGAVPQSEYNHQFEINHHGESHQRDWYYVRVRQKNNQWAWSSPIWVEA